MNFIDNGIDDLQNEHVNLNILGVNINNMILVIFKGKFDAVDDEDT